MNNHQPRTTQLTWINFFHIYQPPNWDVRIIERVANESYRPLLHILKKRPEVRITLNITGALTEQLVRHKCTDIIDDLKALVARGQVELTGSAKYHTILPLLPKEEIDRQIRLNTEVNRAILGDLYAPKGFFPPEMCYSYNMAEAVRDAGFSWILLDEISYSGKLGVAPFDRRFTLHGTDLAVLFRNRSMSDYLAFAAPVDNADQTMATIRADGRAHPYLVTAMDGENLGHHRPHANVLWEALVAQTRTRTVSDYLAELREAEEVNPIRASWSSREDELTEGIPYVLWQHTRNPIHQLQWPLTYLAIEAVLRAFKGGDPKFGDARLALDQAIASDQYWWASAQPWWSAEIVERGARLLLHIFEILTTVSSKEREHAGKLAQLIIDETRQWQETGEAERIRDAYLSSGGQVRYMGGERISE